MEADQKVRDAYNQAAQVALPDLKHVLSKLDPAQNANTRLCEVEATPLLEELFRMAVSNDTVLSTRAPEVVKHYAEHPARDVRVLACKIKTCWRIVWRGALHSSASEVVVAQKEGAA